MYLLLKDGMGFEGKNSNAMEVHWKIRFLVRGKGLWKNQYTGRYGLIRGAWIVCRFKSGFGKKEGRGVFEGGFIPQWKLRYMFYLLPFNICWSVVVSVVSNHYSEKWRDNFGKVDIWMVFVCLKNRFTIVFVSLPTPAVSVLLHSAPWHNVSPYWETWEKSPY